MASFTPKEQEAIARAVAHGRVQRVTGEWREQLPDAFVQRMRDSGASRRAAASSARTRRSGQGFQVRPPDETEAAE